MNKVEFIEIFKKRRKKLTVDTIKIFRRVKPSAESKIISSQLMRCAASVAANYRAACRARSKAEFFSKMSIVVEEADETLFWVEVVEEIALISKKELANLKNGST